MMKFFAAFFVTGTLLMGATNLNIPTKIEVQPLVPSRIVDSKKIEPIKVPHMTCIVNHMEEAHSSLEERMSLCLRRRDWLNINIEYSQAPI